LSSSFSFQTQRRQSTQENKKEKTKRKEGAYLQAPVLPSHFWFLLLPSHFYPFVLNGFSFIYFSSQVEEMKKKTKKKKTIEKKKNAEKGRSFPLSSCSAMSLLALASALLVLPFCFKHFFLTSSSSQTEEKKKNQRKKTIEKKKWRERKEFTFKLSLCPFTFGSCFSPLVSTLSFQAISP
jgi:hypothetical protein